MGFFTNVAITRRSAGEWHLVAVWVCFLLAFGSCSSTQAVELVQVGKKHHGPSTLVLYEHEDRVAGPLKSVVTTASPSGNDSIEFGTINVIANILRDGIANDSTVLGRAAGQVTFEKDLSLSLAFTFVVSTPSYNGTLTAQGVLDASGNGEVVITGGTVDFRFARGYAEVLTVSTDPANVVFKNTLHLKYD